MTTETNTHRSCKASSGRAVLGSILLVITASEARAGDTPDEAGSGTITSFAEGKWDAAKWTPVRLPHQKKLKTFTQRDESIGVTAFTAAEKKNRLDNVLLMADTGTAEGEFEVSFSLSEQSGTAPGVFLAPTVRDGVLDTSIALFVASYTMAVWKTEIDPATGETKYTHLVRVNRWTEPNRKHVLRCRFSRKRDAVVIRLDQSDPIMLRNVGIEMNSLMGVWGCHGPCDFYSVTFIREPILEWAASAPKEQPVQGAQGP